MNNYTVEFDPAAEKDLATFANSQVRQIRKMIQRVATNPLLKNEGGYGDPLGHKYDLDLTGLCKIKLLKLGIRAIYRVVHEGKTMKIIVISARADDKACGIAAKRIRK